MYSPAPDWWRQTSSAASSWRPRWSPCLHSASPCCSTAHVGICWPIPCSRFRRYALMPGPR